MLGQQRLGPAESQKHLVFPLLPQKRAGYRAPTPHTGTVRAREVQRPRLSYREHASGAETTPPNADAMPLLQRPRVLRQRPCPLPRRPRLLVQRPHPQCRGHASLTETTSPAAEAIPPGAETTSPMQRPCLLLQRPCFLVQRRHLPAQRPRLLTVRGTVHIKKAPFSHTGSLLLWRTPENLSQVTSYSSKNRHRVERKCCFLKRHKGHFKIFKINPHNHAQNHIFFLPHYFVQFSSVTQSCLTLCDPTDCYTPGLPIYHHLPELAQTHVH